MFLLDGKTFYKGFLLSSLSRSFLKACFRNISKGNLKLLIWLQQALPDSGIFTNTAQFFSLPWTCFWKSIYLNLFNWTWTFIRNWVSLQSIFFKGNRWPITTGVQTPKHGAHYATSHQGEFCHHIQYNCYAPAEPQGFCHRLATHTVKACIWRFQNKEGNTY